MTFEARLGKTVMAVLATMGAGCPAETDDSGPSIAELEVLCGGATPPEG